MQFLDRSSQGILYINHLSLRGLKL